MNRRLNHKAAQMHGMYFHQDPDGLGWFQYWRGVQHTWYWRGVPVWTRMRKRRRPMYELVKRIAGG